MVQIGQVSPYYGTSKMTSVKFLRYIWTGEFDDNLLAAILWPVFVFEPKAGELAVSLSAIKEVG